MLSMNGTDYRLCLLDTNAVSEMVKRSDMLGNFLSWTARERPTFVPCFSPFTLLELRRKVVLYEQFLERFSPVPCLLLKSHEQLLEDEVAHYPDPSQIDASLLGFAPLGGEGNRLAKGLPLAFQDPESLEKEHMWNEGQDEIVAGIRSLVANYPPSGKTYTRDDLRMFLWIAALQQLRLRVPGFAADMVAADREIDVDAFSSLKASLYTVFYKFYVDPTRSPSRSDAFDIIIAAATPYVEAVITENHQAEVLRKTKRIDDFIDELQIFTLRDFRDAPPLPEDGSSKPHPDHISGTA